jgi:hypothetical protein
MSYLDDFPSIGQKGLRFTIGLLLQSRSEHGLNKIIYWGVLGLKVKFDNQYAENTLTRYTKNMY